MKVMMSSYDGINLIAASTVRNLALRIRLNRARSYQVEQFKRAVEYNRGSFLIPPDLISTPNEAMYTDDFDACVKAWASAEFMDEDTE